MSNNECKTQITNQQKGISRVLQHQGCQQYICWANVDIKVNTVWQAIWPDVINNYTGLPNSVGEVRKTFNLRCSVGKLTVLTDSTKKAAVEVEVLHSKMSQTAEERSHAKEFAMQNYPSLEHSSQLEITGKNYHLLRNLH